MTNSDQHVNGGTPSGGLAAVKNVARFVTLVQSLRNRQEGLPGMGCFYGYSGLGKTYASIYAQNMTNALRLEVGDSWTKLKFLQNLLREAGIEPGRATIADLTERAIHTLADDWTRPLFIDEADKLADKGMLELVREIHEHSQVPVLLIGEELLPEKLEKVERVHNRVLDWVPADPCDHDDARLLANLVCNGLDLSDELIDAVVDKTGGRARRLVVNFNKIREYARNYRVSQLTPDLFDDGFFYTGERRKRHARRAA